MVYLGYCSNFLKFDLEFHQDLDICWGQEYSKEKKFAPQKTQVHKDGHLKNQYLYYKNWDQRTGHKKIAVYVYDNNLKISDKRV